MKTWRALDLFCGGGGASKGLVEAGFEVVGVDINPQPHYPYRFIQADASKVDLRGFDFIWASPPCQRHSAATRNKDAHACFIEITRRRLKRAGVPYCIENVVGAPLINPITLCGAMFGLATVRHRLFECNFEISQPPHVPHKGSVVTGEYVTVAGNGGVPAWTLKEREKRGLPRHIPGEMSLERWQEAMGIDWLPRKPLTQAIPPAFAKFVADRFFESLDFK